MLRSIGKQSGESVESVSPEEAKVGYCGVEGFAEKERFKPGRSALTGKHDTLVRRAHQMLNAALKPGVKE